MRYLLIGVVGVVLLLAGAVTGVAGTALLVTHPCQPTYQLALEPSDNVDAARDNTTALDDLSGVQRSAVQAALENETERSFRDRDALDELTDTVVTKNDSRYVPRLVEVACSTPYSDIAFVGFATGLVGTFLTCYTILGRRLS